MSKRKCTFSDKLKGNAKYAHFERGRNESEAKCTLCDCFVSVANKGAGDLEKHLVTEKHKKCLKTSTSYRKLESFLTSESPENTIREFKIRAGEGALAYHTVVHHQTYSSMECTPKLNKTIFLDSDVAKNMTCGKTKTEAIVNNVLAPHAKQTLINTLNNIPFYGLGTDASNHGAVKMFPIVVQYFDWQKGIQTKLLELASLTSETSEAIAEYIMSTLKRENILSKCVAFAGDNANVNFGGLSRKAGNNVITRLKQNLNTCILGVGCSAHILHNCLQYGADSLQVDIECIIFKIFNYFSIYTVRTEKLREFCDFVDISFQQLLYHSKTRWLSMFPVLERLLKMYPALKAYFLSLDNCPVVLKNFFENEMSELYLWFLHSTMHIFHTNVASIERETISVMEINVILSNVLKSLKERYRERFLPLKIKMSFNTLIENGYHREVDNFKAQVENFYQKCISYLEKWAAPLSDFEPFKWMLLNDSDFKFDDVVPSLEYLSQLGICIDDSKLLDETIILKEFLKSFENNNDFTNLSLDQKWCQFYKNCKNLEIVSQLLIICQFYFAIPANNATVERIFSFISSQWTKERNRLSIDSVKGMILLKYNFKNYTCSDFYTYLSANQDLLKKIGSSDKYCPNHKPPGAASSSQSDLQT